MSERLVAKTVVGREAPRLRGAPTMSTFGILGALRYGWRLLWRFVLDGRELYEETRGTRYNAIEVSKLSRSLGNKN